jgi:hypothetical protein
MEISSFSIELSRSSLLLCFGVSLLCERKRFCTRCLGLDVTLCAMHCSFSSIFCCGNMITEPLSSNGRLALPPLWRLSDVMSQYFVCYILNPLHQIPLQRGVTVVHERCMLVALIIVRFTFSVITTL